MRPKLIIASFGGSGSTYLTKKLKQFANNKYELMHSHASPDSADFLGLPVFNLNGAVEGPFSKDLEMPSGTKIVLILRTPSQAFRSRFSYKHFQNLWSGSQLEKDKELFFEDQKAFFKFSKQCLEDERDPLFFESYMRAWLALMENKKADVLFLKYEHLSHLGNQVKTFLEIDADLDFSDFSARDREVDDVAKAALKSADELYAGLPEFTSSAAQNNTVKEQTSFPKIDLNIAIDFLGAGAGDAISRYLDFYDFVSTVSNHELVKFNYVNYHCKELDFFELFNVPGRQVDESSFEKIESLSLLDLVYLILLNPSSFNANTLYKISLKNQADFSSIKYFKRLFNIPSIARKKLTYCSKLDNESIKFSADESVSKLVVHLRRSDIVGRLIKPEIEFGPIGEHGLHSRPLLHLHHIPDVLQEHDITGKIEVVVISDGLEDVKARYKDNIQVVEKLNELSDELEHGRFDYPQTTLVDRVIGKDSQSTLQTIEYMYKADYVITASSVFPRLIANLGYTKVIKVF